MTLFILCSNSLLCSRTNQLACETGDLTGKHGPLQIPATADGILRAVFTDANLPLHTLTGLDAVFGKDGSGHVYITPATGELSPSVCAQTGAVVGGASPIAQVSSLIVIFISILCAAVSW